MFAIDIEGMARRVFEGPHIAIGRSTRCDLVLASPEVSRRHAEIVQSGRDFLLDDHGSAHGTWVDGVRITRTAVTHVNQIKIGPFTLTVHADAAVEPTEQRLLAAIATQQDAASRLVYADWLEERGDHARAEFLRLQEQLAAMPPDQQLHDPAAAAGAERMRALAASIEIGWRYRMARPVVEGCAPRFSFQCPRQWDAMSETERPDVRHCGGCNKHVYYCATIARARDHAERGHCVAVDIIPRRAPGDLEVHHLGRTAGMPAPPPPDRRPR